MLKQHRDYFISDLINAPLWRYTDVFKFISIFEEQALYFCRADLFPDPLEGTNTEPTIKIRPTVYEEAPDHWLYVTLPMFESRTKKCVYVSCWHNNWTESKDMWNKYSAKIALKTTLNRLKYSILDKEREYLISCVNYIDYKKDFIHSLNAFAPFFYKDESYNYEKEVRLAVSQNYSHIGDQNFDELSFDKGLFIPVDVTRLIEQVVVNPSVNKEEFRYINHLMKMYNIQKRLSISKY